MKKESYVQPAVAKHELLRDITAKRSGYGGGPPSWVPGPPPWAGPKGPK